MSAVNLVCTCGGALFKTEDVATGSADPRKAVDQLLTCAVIGCGKRYTPSELRAAQVDRPPKPVQEFRRQGYRSER